MLRQDFQKLCGIREMNFDTFIHPVEKDRDE